MIRNAVAFPLVFLKIYPRKHCSKKNVGVTIEIYDSFFQQVYRFSYVLPTSHGYWPSERKIQAGGNIVPRLWGAALESPETHKVTYLIQCLLFSNNMLFILLVL